MFSERVAGVVAPRTPRVLTHESCGPGKMTEYTISFVTVGGVRLRVATAGDGPPLLFLFGSGAAGTIENAKPFVDRFSGLFTVACPDQRGLGQSDIPDGPWTMSDYAADAIGVADHLGWDTFSIIGLSFGGMVGLEMAAEYPDRIDRMVLWGCSPGGRAHSYPLHLLTDLPPEERHRLFAHLMDIRLADRSVNEESPEAQLVHAVLSQGGSPWSVAEGVAPARQAGLLRQLQARKDFDVVDRLGQIICPTMIGAGTYDGLAPVHNAEVMHAGIARSVLRVYEAGHFFYLGRKAFTDGLNFLLGLTPMPTPGQPLTADEVQARFGGSCTTT